LQQRSYVSDIEAAASIDLPWGDLDGKTIAISGASGQIGQVLLDLLAARARLGDHFNIIALRKQDLPPRGSDEAWPACLTQAANAPQPGASDIGVGSDASINGEVPAQKNDHGRVSPVAAFQNEPAAMAPSAGSITWIAADLADGQSAERLAANLPNIDYLIHGAALTHPRAYASAPIDTIETTILGSRTILDLAIRQPACRLLLLSTVDVYGADRSGRAHPWREDEAGFIDPLTLRSGYPQAKRLMESLGVAYAAQYRLDWSVVRLPRVFGPTIKLDDSKAASQFLLAGAGGAAIPLESSGEQRFSFLYSVDAALAVMTVLLRGADGQAYNAAHPAWDLRLGDLARLIAERSGEIAAARLIGSHQSGLSVRATAESLEQASPRRVKHRPPSPSTQTGQSPVEDARMDASRLISLGWFPRQTVMAAIDHTLMALAQRMVSDQVPMLAGRGA
jgi:nucleoside-diphosphate-sugar epimerase